MITYEMLKKNEAIRAYISMADRSLGALGYTEHSFAHVCQSAETAAYILETMGFGRRDVELAKIAGYLHDIGNLVNRSAHSQSGAIMAFQILTGMGMDPYEVAAVCTAIGNHDEGTGVPVSPMAAALILADKSDVRRSRVRSQPKSEFDIHDRVNYSVIASKLEIDAQKENAVLELTIDTEYGSVMDYFEIFMQRMLMCRRAAEELGLRFRLMINGQRLL